MKYTTDDIRQAIKGSQCPVALFYLQAELNRRNGSKSNTGRPVKFTDEKHVKDRERRRKDNGRSNDQK